MCMTKLLSSNVIIFTLWSLDLQVVRRLKIRNPPISVFLHNLCEPFLSNPIWMYIPLSTSAVPVSPLLRLCYYLCWCWWYYCSLPEARGLASYPLFVGLHCWGNSGLGFEWQPPHRRLLASHLLTARARSRLPPAQGGPRGGEVS